MTRWHPRWIAVGAIALTLVVVATYAGLAVYKAYDYTNTPRQNTSAIFPPNDGLTYQDVSFPSAASDGVTLSGWWVPNAGSHRVVILVHGRYANRMQMLPLVKPLWSQGYNVLLFDLRAHGKSTHTESTYGIKEQWDVIGAARFVQGRGFGKQSIGVIGWSLGGASTLMALGSSNDFAAAVADSSYANSAPLLARNPLQPGLRLAMKWVRGVDLSQADPAESIRGLQGPQHHAHSRGRGCPGANVAGDITGAIRWIQRSSGLERSRCRTRRLVRRSSGRVHAEGDRLLQRGITVTTGRPRWVETPRLNTSWLVRRGAVGLLPLCMR